MFSSIAGPRGEGGQGRFEGRCCGEHGQGPHPPGSGARAPLYRPFSPLPEFGHTFSPACDFDRVLRIGIPACVGPWSCVSSCAAAWLCSTQSCGPICHCLLLRGHEDPGSVCDPMCMSFPSSSIWADVSLSEPV